MMRINVKIAISVVCAFIIIFGAHGLIYYESTKTSTLIGIV